MKLESNFHEEVQEQYRLDRWSDAAGEKNMERGDNYTVSKEVDKDKVEEYALDKGKEERLIQLRNFVHHGERERK